MKAILISIKPKWCALIMNGEKTIEIRTNKPNVDLPIDVYIYCTKDKELLHKNCADIYWVEDKDFKAKNKKLGLKTQPYLNGKVVAKFTLNRVEKYPYISDKYDELIGSCLSEKELLDYSTIRVENDIIFVKTLYAWHISNLVIFDKPKELSEFSNCDKYPYTKYIGKAPQSFMFIEVEK